MKCKLCDGPKESYMQNFCVACVDRVEEKERQKEEWLKRRKKLTVLFHWLNDNGHFSGDCRWLQKKMKDVLLEFMEISK